MAEGAIFKKKGISFNFEFEKKISHITFVAA